MPSKNDIPTTQRAYTMRINGIDPNDKSWRDALWNTHEAVNKGAKAFGDWLLTLRGGLDHGLADADEDKTKKEEEKCKEEKKCKRILLALSWLSVESKRGAPEKYIVAYGSEVAKDRNEKVLGALREILKKRRWSIEEKLISGEIEKWVEDCTASLNAAIRDDAVWVNRSLAFDEEFGDLDVPQIDIWDFLGRFFNNSTAYLMPLKLSDGEDDKTEQEEKAKDLVQKAGQWLSSRFGSGEGADFERFLKVYLKIGEWAENDRSHHNGEGAIFSLAEYLNDFGSITKNLEGILRLIAGPGYKSGTRNLLKNFAGKRSLVQSDYEILRDRALDDAEKSKSNIGSKKIYSYSNLVLGKVEKICKFTYRTDKNGEDVPVDQYINYDEGYKWGKARHKEYSVILDHAARRVSVTHSWIKRAEAERRKFEDDALKIHNIPAIVKNYLDSFCDQRSDISGALEPYRIRKRALDGWEKVVNAWGKATCKTTEDRINVARALQDDPEIEKFGDTQLFEALAQDDALCVWHKDGDISKQSDHQLLIDYALATDAENKKKRFKVPAYRHPDALLHPVFCDFGNSRWEIKYSFNTKERIIEDLKLGLKNNNENLEKEKERLIKLQESGRETSKVESEISKIQKRIDSLSNDLKKCISSSRFSMDLFDGRSINNIDLRWHSKRLISDFALKKPNDYERIVEVNIGNRFGMAQANVKDDDLIKIKGLAEQDDLNGRLQAPREQLDAIAKRVDKHGWDNVAIKMRDSLKWLITFSPKLQPQGPWFEYIENLADKKPFERSIKSGSGKGGKRLSLEGWPHGDENENRKSQTRLILSRLPGLRLLSVDLGHRYAASCAVWEAISSEQMIEECKKVGHRNPDPDDLYIHLKKNEIKPKKGKLMEAVTTTIYRRIGADLLPDKSPHPAPWAKLDRQFIIKLQGEEEGARQASNEEIWAVHQMEKAFYRDMPLIDKLMASGWGKTDKQKRRLEALKRMGWIPLEQDESSIKNDDNVDESDFFKPSLSVDELMYSAIRTMRLALKRHGDRARIAHAMLSDYKIMPGDRRYYFSEAKDSSSSDGPEIRTKKHIQYIHDALVMWHNLNYSRGWHDHNAKKMWNIYVSQFLNNEILEYISGNESGQDRKAKEDKNSKKLYQVAELLHKDPVRRAKIHNAWKELWLEDDEKWKRQLRWFKDWIHPRGKSSEPSIRKMGGLSLARISAITEFRRKVQMGFYTRHKIDGLRSDIKEQFGQRSLDALEQLREQRVKQLASRIVEAALGVGRIKHPIGGKTPKRPIERVDATCQAIIIENLERYRPEETRTRRENRQLMSWASSKVKKYLSESCQLNGLHLREVSASYTSRQDSRTGAPGIRCQDVPVLEFMKSPFWRKQVAQASKLSDTNKGDSRDKLLLELDKIWEGKKDQWNKANALRLPVRGGDLFVSADPDSPVAKGLQADLNAAANIGLKALLDPDWPGKWWYVPCDSSTYKPIKEKVNGCAVVNSETVLRKKEQSSEDESTKLKKSKKKSGKSGEVVNLWRDISSLPLDEGNWIEYAVYQNKVQYKVIKNLRKQMGLVDSSSFDIQQGLLF